MREVRAVMAGAGVVTAYLCVVLWSGRVDFAQFAKLFLAYASGSILLWAIVGTLVLIVQVVGGARRSGRDAFLVAFVRESLEARWMRDRGASLIWPPLLFATLMASFNAFKQLVLPIAGFSFDPWLARADRAFFLGHDGWRVTHALFGSPEATRIIDGLYHGWFLPMSLGVVLCAWLPAATYRLRTQYLLSYIAVWIGLGSILAFLFPSAGPCFYAHFVGPAPEYAPLMSRLNEIQALNGQPLMALHNQSYLIKAHATDQLLVGGGISAMPSVHNGLAFLFALAARQVSRPLGYLFAAYAAGIWIGSIHLGWHYGLDGIVALALTLGIWGACGRIADRLEKPLLSQAVEPALA